MSKALLRGLLSLALMTGLGAFFLIYCSAFVRTPPAVPYLQTPIGSPGHTQAELPPALGLASYLVTTALIIAPFLYTFSGARRPPFGIATILVAVVAWLPLAMSGLPEPRSSRQRRICCLPDGRARG